MTRHLDWKLFCAANDIGDLNHNVCFANINQSEGKIEYAKKFVLDPQGILFMQGEKGTGKTYMSLAICEAYTRKTGTQCKFMTQSKLVEKWINTFKKDEISGFVDKITTCQLLIIDDFGTAEPTTAFMRFFMDLINTRMQWSDRGTIITTNLNDAKFGEYCGDALYDRINTGQKFIFEGSSRRVKTVL